MPVFLALIYFPSLFVSASRMSHQVCIYLSSCCRNVSKYNYAFSDFPFPAGAVDYPHHSQMAEYIDQYVDNNQLYNHILYRTRVLHVSRYQGNTSSSLAFPSFRLYEWIVHSPNGNSCSEGNCNHKLMQTTSTNVLHYVLSTKCACFRLNPILLSEKCVGKKLK